MESPRFRDIPLAEVVNLHFVPDEQQMIDWLNSLSSFDQTLAVEKILQVTRALDPLDIKTSLKIKFLQRIQPHFTKIVNTLQKSYLDASLPLSDEETKKVELVVWNYMQLARVWRNCKLKYTAISKEQQAWLLYSSLEAMNLALLHISLSYKAPMHGFWSLCYELYARAEQANLTHINIIRDGGNINSIAKLFKHLLIFYLCDTQQFRCRDMLMLFESLADYSAEAGILSNYQPKWQPVVCIFNLNKDLPPQKINPVDARDDLSERFITTVIVAKSIYETLQKQTLANNALRSINHETLLRALNTLGLARKRKFTRISEKTEFTGVIGFNGLIQYLQLKNNLPLLQPQQPAPIKFDPRGLVKAKKTEFDLVPIGGELAHQMRETHKYEIRQNEQLSKIFSFDDKKPTTVQAQTFQPSLSANNVDKPESELCLFEIQDSSAKGYGLITKLPTTQVKIGDIIAILTGKTERIEVGLVRRINQLSDQHVRLGVEVIGFESELVYVANPKLPTQGFWAIFLSGVKSLKQADSLIFNSSLFKQGDAVEIRGKEKCQPYQLQKIRQITSAATHMELLNLANSDE